MGNSYLRRMTSRIQDVVVIGYGNVGSHLINWLRLSGVQHIQLYSRSQVPSIQGISVVAEVEDIKRDADFYILALNDQSITSFMKDIGPFDGLWVHTSASLSEDAFPESWSRTGVLYPLQTFSKNFPMNYEGIPLLIEAKADHDLIILRELALRMSNVVVDSNPAMRLNLHVAAVFACNFNNHLMHVAESLLKENGLDFELIRPLIKQTVEKALHNNPSHSQTGPAFRGDQTTMMRHLEALAKYQELQDIYKLLSSNIAQYKTKDSDND